MHNEEEVQKLWGNVVSLYQTRHDKIEQLVPIVQGYAAHEKETLTAVINARASATSIKLTPELMNDPSALAKFEQAQGSIVQALSKLMVLSEKYPELKADRHFSDLMASVEGMENRISVARQRYNEGVKDFNESIRPLPFGKPVAAIAGFERKNSFEVKNEAEISTAPKINFGTQPAAPIDKPIPAYNQ